MIAVTAETVNPFQKLIQAMLRAALAPFVSSAKQVCDGGGGEAGGGGEGDCGGEGNGGGGEGEGDEHPPQVKAHCCWTKLQKPNAFIASQLSSVSSHG